MMRGRRVCAAVLGAMLAAAGGAAAADFSGLQAWVGRYPFDRVGGRVFLDQPGLRPAIQHMLGAEYRAWSAIRGPSPPVMKVGDVVAANYCQAHDCGDKNTTVLVNLVSGALALCWTNAPARAGARWFVAGRAPAQGPEPSCPNGEDEVRTAIRRLGL